MTRYRLTKAALLDLEAIWRFTATNWQIAQADSYIAEIRTAIEELADGRRPDLLADRVRPGYRKCLAQSHVIYFRRDKDLLVVARILHQSMDPTPRL